MALFKILHLIENYDVNCEVWYIEVMDVYLVPDEIRWHLHIVRLMNPL